MVPEDQENTTFTTPWGTFMYAKILFGLMNAGETFQRDMDIALLMRKINLFLFTYMISPYIQFLMKNILNLRKTFQKCRKFCISLNPKKSNFVMEEGNFLGHII
jgi:hypothetical protein